MIADFDALHLSHHPRAPIDVFDFLDAFPFEMSQTEVVFIVRNVKTGAV